MEVICLFDRPHLEARRLIEPDPRLVRAASVAKRLGRTGLFDELRFAAYGVGWLNMRPFPGYTGRPAWASEAIGEAFTNLLIDRFAVLATAVLEGRLPHPAPILAWLPGASLGGRVSTASPLREGDLLALSGLGDHFINAGPSRCCAGGITPTGW